MQPNVRISFTTRNRAMAKAKAEAKTATTNAGTGKQTDRTAGNEWSPAPFQEG